MKTIAKSLLNKYKDDPNALAREAYREYNSSNGMLANPGSDIPMTEKLHLKDGSILYINKWDTKASFASVDRPNKR